MTNLHARLAFWLFALLLLTKFSPIGAGLTLVVVVFQVFIGMQILALFTVTSELSEFSKIGLGFSLGAIISSLIYVLVVSVASVPIALCSQFVLAVGATYLMKTKPTTDRGAIDHDEIATVKWLAVATLAGLSPEWFWPLPVAVFLAVAFIGQNVLRSKSLWFKCFCALFYSGAGFFVWLQILKNRPDRSWFPDDQFAELWSHSVGKWGVSHNPMLMGESISYHWFSFAWVGLISNLTSVDVGDVLSLFAPVVVGVACAVLGYSIVRSFVRNSMSAIAVLIIAFLVDTERFFRGFGFHAFQVSSFSQFFSLFLGLGITLVVVKVPLSTSMHNLIALMLFGLIGSKVSSGLSILFGLICVSLYQILRIKQGLKKSLIYISALIVASSVSFVFFLGNPRNGTASVIRRPGWPVGNIADLVHVYNSTLLKYLPILIFLVLALGGLGLVTLLNIKNLSAKLGTQRVVGAYIVGCYLASLSQMWIAQAMGSNSLSPTLDNTLYAYQFVTAISILIVLANICGMLEDSSVQQLPKRVVLFVLVFALFLFSLKKLWKIENTDVYWTPFLTSLRPALPFFSALLISSVVYFVWRPSKRLGFIGSVTTWSVASLVASGLFVSADNYISFAAKQQAEWRSVDESYVATPDIESASKWIRNNTKRSDVIATKVQTRAIPLSVLMDRRSFAGFPMDIMLYGVNNDQQKVKRKSLDNFIIFGDCESAWTLRAYGVSYFLLNLADSPTTKTKICASEIFRNRTIVIYLLK